MQGMPMHTQELQVRRWSQTLIERFDVEPLYQNPIAAMFRSEHLRRYQMTKNYIHKQALVHNLSIVDAGCGLGYGWEYLSPFGAYIGLDHSREAILEARTRFPEGDFRTADLNEDNAIRATVDVVVSHETAEHLESPVRFFQMVARALRTGGIFCFSAPTCLTMDYDPFHLRDWNAHMWGWALSKAGFEIRESVAMPFFGKFTDFAKCVPTTFRQKLRIAKYVLTHGEYRRDRRRKWIYRNRFEWESHWFACEKV